MRTPTLESERAAVWVKAKRIGRSPFQEHQLAGTLAALLSEARDRTPLLLLVLGAPPPVQVRGAGPLNLAKAVERSLPHLGPAVDRRRLRDGAESVCWITWVEIDAAIADAAAGYGNTDASTLAAVHRMAAGVRGAIARHG